MTVRAVAFLCLSILAVRTPFSEVALAAAADEQASRTKVASPSDAVSNSSAAATAGDYVIGADDLLSVVFWRDQQLTSDALVRPDGKISLPLLDDVAAAGLTPRQLRDHLTVEAKRFITEPIVTVVVKQINSRKVYITGLVVRPGQYPLASEMTVLQLIATAGGLQDYAKARDIRVVRVDHGQSVILPFDFEEMAKAKSAKPAQNIVLKPGDTIIVP
jgi:polysaccharide export outer membrane protein